MPYLLVRHTVADYERWKPVFDEHASFRKASGSRGGRILRSSANPNEVIILFEWDSLERARQFAASADLRAAMERAGVSGRPDIYFLDDEEQISF